MNKYVKAVLIFLFYWAIVGTGIAMLLDLFVSPSLNTLGILLGVGLGIYFAYKAIRQKKN